MGFQAAPWDITSNSRFVLQRGGVSLTTTITRPFSFVETSLPLRNYTVELATQKHVLRYGDLTPNFTSGTSSFFPVHGVEARVKPLSWLEVQAVSGQSRRPTPARRYGIGSFEQRFGGGRLVASVAGAVSLGLTALKVHDVPGSVDFSRSYYRPRARENLVLGSDVTCYFARRRGSLAVEYAASIYNADLSAGFTSGRANSDGARAGWLAGRGTIRDLVTINDSTRVGELMLGRVTLPFSRPRISLEYRRTSRAYTSLVSPYEAMDAERYRINNSVSLLKNRLLASGNLDLSRSNLSRSQPFAARTFNFNGNIVWSVSRSERYTLAWRRYDRWNDAAPPIDGRWDRRMNGVTRSLSLLAARDSGIAGLPLRISAAVTVGQYTDRIRSLNDSRTQSLQVNTETQSTDRVIWSSQATYSLSAHNGGRPGRRGFQLLTREGYQVIPSVLHVYATGGLSSGDPWNRDANATAFLWGSGVKWAPKAGKEVEVQWQSASRTDIGHVANMRGRQAFSVRANYGF